MAVTLDASPPTGVYVGLGVEYKLSLDSAGTDPIEKRMWYELLVGGSQVGSRRVAPYVPGGVTIDFSPMIVPLFSTGFLSLTSTATQDISSYMDLSVQIRYGEYEYNKDTGAQTETSNTTSSAIDVVNVYARYNEDQELPIGKRWLTTKPEHFIIGTEQSDWICVDGGGNVQFEFFENGVSASQGGLQSIATTGPTAIPIGGKNFHSAFSLKAGSCVTGGYVIFNGVRKSFEYRPCKRGGQLFFRDPAGGFNSMWFDRIETSVGRSSQRYEQYAGFVSSGATRATTGGTREIRPTGTDVVRFTTDVLHANVKHFNEYISALMSAKEHYILTDDIQGSSGRLTRFIVDAATAPARASEDKVTVSITGRVARTNNS